MIEIIMGFELANRVKQKLKLVFSGGADTRVTPTELDHPGVDAIDFAVDIAPIATSKQASLRDLRFDLEVGQVVEGVVVKIKPYGAILQIGGVQALLRSSNISWDSTVTAENSLDRGATLLVAVLSIQPRERWIQITVGMKQMTADPYIGASKHYKPGGQHKGVVTSITEKVMIVQLAPLVQGFIVIPPKSDLFPDGIGDSYKVGDSVRVYIHLVNEAQHRIVLALTKPARRSAGAKSKKYKSRDRKDYSAQYKNRLRQDVEGELEKGFI
jgi:ribosomal protein S1